ncbi:MAG: phospho-sugar mutase [Prevotellaceae bacterium]|jgi:phosphoglucomutase|nr:phospho-sugar mutase [Prevotellaceae bacterium]
MEHNELVQLCEQKAKAWLAGNYNEQTKTQVRQMLENEDKTLLIDSFYQDLEFGTGGLRGIMGAGSNRMNIYTVGAATQGLANYLKAQFADIEQISVVVGYDCRNNSQYFAGIVANIFAANGIKVYLFENLRPTPEISFAIRHFKCQSGVMITASHNPKEYNGYKAYWNDGAQFIAPHDTNVIDEVNKITNIDDIRFGGEEKSEKHNHAEIEIIGEDIDKIFLENVKKLSLSPDAIKRNSDLKIVYSPIHGCGRVLIPRVLNELGFTNVITVPEQMVQSGDFPTVASPNPEEPAALELAIKKAQSVDADIAMASDPDADRLGITVKNTEGEWILINGNQTFMIFIYYLLTKWKENGKLSGNEYIVKTIVTTEIIKDIAEKFGVEMFDCYTGFKWIAAIMRENEGKKAYIGGGEESYGLLAETFCRDKDAVSACALMAEITAWAKDNGKTWHQMLQDVYIEFGYSKEKGISVVRKGQSGAAEIKQMMTDYRQKPPTEIAGSGVLKIKDFQTLKQKNILENTETDLEMPTTSNVLQFFTEDGTKISVRPSGTEPKIKFYIEVRDKLKNREDFEATEKRAEQKIQAVTGSLGI